MLEPILQQVGAGNPQLARLIGENPDQFLQLLSEDTGDDTPLPPGAQEISVTEEERDAIERVSLLELSSLHVWTAFADLLSYVAWASSAIRSSRCTLRVTRTRRWQRTFCLINLMMRRKGVLDGSRFLFSMHRAARRPDKTVVMNGQFHKPCDCSDGMYRQSNRPCTFLSLWLVWS